MAHRPRAQSAARGQAGQALLVVLAILVVVTASSTLFIWFMNQQQARAGVRLRAQVALGLAETAVHTALAVLEAGPPEGAAPDRPWWPARLTGDARAGALPGRWEAVIAEDAGGVLLVSGEGRAGDVVRVLRARVVLASPALLSAVFAASTVEFEPGPAAAIVVPYGAGLGDRPWVHVAAGEELWFADAGVALNDPTVGPDALPGPADTLGPGAPTPATAVPRPLRVLLSDGAALTYGRGRQQVDDQQLRVAGLRLAGAPARTDRLPRLPVPDRDYYRGLAAANLLNEAANRDAGRLAGDGGLERKRDSAYSEGEMAAVLAALASAPGPVRLRGVVYVAGRATIPARTLVHIEDGTLVAASTVQINPDGELRVTHTPATRTLPGVITLGNGAIVVANRARLRVHGLVYASRVFDTGRGAEVEITGALASADPEIGVRINGAALRVRYDAAILGTPGLRVARGDPAIAWVAAWEELPR